MNPLGLSYVNGRLLFRVSKPLGYSMPKLLAEAPFFRTGVGFEKY